METTTNYSLKKPAGTDNYNVLDQNSNMDTIDVQMKANADAINTHKTAATLDHPDGSVTTAKLADGAVTAAKVAADVATQAELDAHAAATTAHGSTSAATANRIMMRDASGRAKVAAPSASDDIARKAETDAALSAANAAQATADAALQYPADYGIGVNAPVVSDLNVLAPNSDSGFYRALASTLNMPSGITSGGTVIHIARDSRPTQLFSDYLTGHLYTRGYDPNGWRPWLAVIDSAGGQTINGDTTVRGDLISKAFSGTANTNIFLKDDVDTNRGVLFWQRSDGSVMLTNYAASKALNLKADGTLFWGANKVWDRSDLRTTNGYVEWNDNGTWKAVGGVKTVHRGLTTLTGGISGEGGTVVNVTVPTTSGKVAITHLSEYVNNNLGALGYLLEADMTSTTNLRIRRGDASSTGTVSISWEVTEHY